MLEYKINGLEAILRSKPEEITVKEFMEISELKSLGDLENYIETLKVLGFSEEVIDELDSDTLFEIIRDFQNDFKIDKETLQKEMIFNNEKYIAYEDKFIIKAKQMAKFEKKINDGKIDWMTYVLASIFKKESLTETEHNDESHIKFKAKQFENLTLDIALPYLVYVSENFIKNFKILNLE